MGYLPAMTPLLWPLGLLIGIALGLLGGGGAILAVPTLTYVAGLDPKVAIATSLPVIGIGSLVGAVRHWRAGYVRLAAAGSFGLVAMLGAFAGARVSDLLDGRVQLVVLGAAMLAAAVSMLRSRQPVPDAATVPPRIGPLFLGTAFGVGLLTGVAGVGGGFMIVPALTLLARLPMREAVGTSLVVIAMNAAAGFAGYVGRVALPLPLAAGFTVVIVAGAIAGARLAELVPQQLLRRLFALFLIVLGLFILWTNRGIFVASGMTPP